VSGPSDFSLFFGRLHPALVHLPIGLMVLLALAEWLARFPRFKQANASAGIILALAVPASMFTVLCGWLLSQAGGYQDQLLAWHKWTGVGTAAVCALAALFYSLDRKLLYRGCLYAGVAVMVVASHFGGSLTHGSDYLVRYAPQPIRGWLAGPAAPAADAADFSQRPVFAALIQPVLQDKCVSCHGPEKAKGGLRLDSLAALQKGGENGTVVVPGKLAEGSFLKRLQLPPEDEDHMPPPGKPQPTADEIALLEWWIAAGTPGDKKLSELKLPPVVERLAQARSGAAPALAKAVPPKPLPEILPVADKLAEELNIAITALSPKDPWLQCNAGINGTNFGNAELAKLTALGPNLRWLDLGGTAVNDAGLAPLTHLSNLTRLHLERTAITDAALACLTPLAQLEYLNLYGTQVTDAGIERLQNPKLRQLYLWQTKVTPAAGKAFVEAHTDRPQLERWKTELEQIQTRIREAQVAVEFGLTLTNAPATTNAPVNAECPVSGKPVNLAKTLVHDGKLVAFCCDDCKSKFQNDPKPFLAKLALNSTTTDAKKNP